MKIALTHFRMGETDGVSLEMDKWRTVLERAGHECVYIAGSSGASKAVIVDAMHYQSKENAKLVNNCYRRLADYASETELEQHILKSAQKLADELVRIISENGIQVVIPNNIWSLGWNLPCGAAFTMAAKRLPNVLFIAHNHDFYWERELYSSPTCDAVKRILEEFFTPRLPNVTHCVINSLASDELKRRKGIEATIVPNVSDFEGTQPWCPDDYNADLRRRIGISSEDIVILQATRITERKAIELAIDVVDEIRRLAEGQRGRVLYNGRVFTKESRVCFLLAGLEESTNDGYMKMRKRKWTAWASYIIAQMILSDIHAAYAARINAIRCGMHIRCAMR